MNVDELANKLKSHIHFEEGMDDTMLSFYLSNAKEYVKKSTGGQSEYLIIMIAGIMHEYRAAEKELEEALNAMTPFFVQEVFYNGVETDEQP